MREIPIARGQSTAQVITYALSTAKVHVVLFFFLLATE